eukprot:2809736-Pleurochrysis_carterae.AAC.1
MSPAFSATSLQSRPLKDLLTSSMHSALVNLMGILKERMNDSMGARSRLANCMQGRSKVSQS